MRMNRTRVMVVISVVLVILGTFTWQSVSVIELVKGSRAASVRQWATTTTGSTTVVGAGGATTATRSVGGWGSVRATRIDRGAVTTLITPGGGRSIFCPLRLSSWGRRKDATS
jgi:hypothetical protein